MKKNVICKYIMRSLLTFVLIYCVSAVLGEGIIIGILYGMGHDPLHGVMPEGQIGELLPYYGYVIFSLVTIAYCKFVEKRTMKWIGFTRKGLDYLLGALLAVILLFIIVGINCVFGSMMFEGFYTNVSIKIFVLWMFAFGVQGAAEEIMCRGFLMNSLQKETSIPVAVVISSTAFVVPHLPSLIEADFAYAVVGIANLYLISIVFSMLVLWRANIWIVCGLHSVWNFVLYWILGLSLSGSESVSKGIILFQVTDTNILNGAEYGIEASIITTIVLGILVFILIKKGKGRISENGI